MSFRSDSNNNWQVLLYLIFVEFLNQSIINYSPTAIQMPTREVGLQQSQHWRLSYRDWQIIRTKANVYSKMRKPVSISEIRTSLPGIMGFCDGEKKSPRLNSMYFPRLSMLSPKWGESLKYMNWLLHVITKVTFSTEIAWLFYVTE